MDIVLATRNRKKAREMTRIFSGFDLRFLTLDAFPGCPEVVEDGRTFRANAVKKAVTVANFSGLPALADDSGLAVDALGGAPGVFSARFAGEEADDLKNMRKLLKDLKGVASDKRTARFVCCIALALPAGQVKTFTGKAEGTIGQGPKGDNGFGYDPIFYPTGHSRTFAEMTADEKDRLSHRGKAMKKLYAYLRKSLTIGHKNN